MKNSELFIGLGVGLLVGAAIGAYLAADDEAKAELVGCISDKVDNVKARLAKIVEEKHGSRV